MADTNITLPGHFWRRFFAYCIDWILVAILVGACGLFLFGPTNGKVRVQSVIWTTKHCLPVSSDFTVSGLPTGFRLTNAAYCSTTFLGHVHDLQLIMQDVRGDGGSKFVWTLHTAVDNKGQPTTVLYLDYLMGLLFAVYVWLTEWKFGATMGKDLVKLRVRSLTRVDGELDSYQAAKRLLRLVPLVPITIGMLVANYSGDATASFYLPGMIGVFGLTFVLSLVIYGHTTFALFKGRLPLYDRWANTAVILGRDQSIPATAPSAV